jgi:PAS domain S-box-containing protein
MNPPAHILIIDDIPLNLEVLGASLAREYDVQFATSGAQGLALVQQQAPDLILLDVMMPGMDGYQVLQILKGDPLTRVIPVIFVTARNDVESETRALEAGAVDFIHKPINPVLVRARVRLQLAAALAQRELQRSLSELRQAQGRLRVLSMATEQSPSAVVICGPDAAIQYVNPQFCQVTGYEAAEVLGRNPRILNSGQNDPAIYLDMWGRLKRGEPWSGELINRHKSGEIFREEAHLAPIKDDEGRTLHYVAVKTDITARHQAEQALALARQRELETGAYIQHKLLFGRVPKDLEACQIACYTEPCQGVDGDFYTFTRLNSSVFEVLSGDVMGKGVTAALIGAGIKNSYRWLFSELMAAQTPGSYPSAAALMNALHAVVTPELIAINAFVTMSLLRIDCQARTVTWVNAGHTPTLLAQGQQVTELIGDNLPIGVLAHEVYAEHRVQLQAGDTLLLYSDGLSESANPSRQYYGDQRIQQLLSQGQQAGHSPELMLATLRSDIEAFTEQSPAEDDRTAVFIQLQAA